jgi:hypothetical protein
VGILVGDFEDTGDFVGLNVGKELVGDEDGWLVGDKDGMAVGEQLTLQHVLRQTWRLIFCCCLFG